MYGQTQFPNYDMNANTHCYIKPQLLLLLLLLLLQIMLLFTTGKRMGTEKNKILWKLQVLEKSLRFCFYKVYFAQKQIVLAHTKPLPGTAFLLFDSSFLEVELKGHTKP